MEIICRYLNEGSYPNEDYFVLRAGYKCDGYDILEKMDNGFWFLGKSSKENVTVRQLGASCLAGDRWCRLCCPSTSSPRNPHDRG